MTKSISLLGLMLACIIRCSGQDSGHRMPKTSDAQKYAGELSKLLVEYQTQLAKKITAEEQAYRTAAKLYDDAFRENVFASLSLDRTADALHAERALRSHALSPDGLIDDVAAYAERDFSATRSLYAMGIDSYKSYLANLNALEIDSNKVTNLISLLNDLATPTNLRTRLTEVTAYQESFNQQLHFSDCSMADSLIEIQNARGAALDKQIQAISTRINNPGPEVDVAALGVQKGELEAAAQEVKDEIGRLTLQRNNSGGFTPAGDGTDGACEVK